MLWIPLAHAASVAVLDFDAQGQSFPAAQRATEAVRGAMLDARLLEPLSARDITAGASAGKDAELRLGTQKVAEARRLAAAGDARGCADRAGEAGDLLLEAAGDVGRRTEVADAYYLQGTCLVAAGAVPDAYFAFAEVTRQYPGYLTERADALDSVIIENLALAQAAADGAGPRRRPPERLAALQRTLGVDYLVTGNLDRKGRLSLTLSQDGRVLGEAQGVIRLPASATDPALLATTHRLVDVAGVGPAAIAASVPTLDPEEILALEEETPEPAEEVADDAGPVGSRWWVWTTAALVAGGGATAVILLTGEPPPPPSESPPTWSIHVPID